MTTHIRYGEGNGRKPVQEALRRHQKSIARVAARLGECRACPANILRR
jgi:hypothetical protein